ncbi:MAG TPA: transcription elongation factor GreA [Thermoleophilaceae bacterium]
MSDAVQMTRDAYQRLEAEVEQLETTGRREIAARLKTAREWGDLKENAEYHDAKKSGSLLEGRIATLRERLLNAEIVESAGGGVAGMDSTVTYSDAASGEQQTFTLVSANDAQPAKGRLSIDSPVGKALQGHRAGDTTTVTTPSGSRELSILTVE